MAALDLSSILLLLGNFAGTSKILELSDNMRYEFHPPARNDDGSANWKGKESDELSGPFLSLVFGMHLFSPQGWVFGSSEDSDICDLQLAIDNSTGISRRHFRIDLSLDVHRPRLTVLSRNAVRITADDRTVTLYEGQSLDLISAVTIDLGAVTMRAWSPILSIEEQVRYHINAERFNQDFLDGLQRIPLKTDSTGTSTLALRFGKNDSRYRREKTWATSNFATIMKVKELRSGKIFAAKVPHFSSWDRAGDVRKRELSLALEYEKIAKLQHPNIVQAFELLPGGELDEPPWLIMEWIENDLRSIHLDESDVPSLLMYVNKGLAYMHARGFAHRDLKPANILVQLKGQRLATAKIADFGTAMNNISGTMDSYKGSAAYAAPELFQNERAYTKAVDLWSLGILAVEFLTRWEIEARFAPNKHEHQEWIRTDLWPRVTNAPEPFRPLLQGMLSETPGERWTASYCGEWLQKNV